MRLSEEGCKNLGYHEAIGLSIGSYDFQTEDFKDGVVLTVEEAKVICNFFDVYKMHFKMFDFEKIIHEELRKRIELAEVKE